MAAEIALLLHRLRERFGKRASEVSHYATSATLGGAGSEEQLRTYASRLFGVARETVSVITGRRQQPQIPPGKLDERVHISAADIAVNVQSRRSIELHATDDPDSPYETRSRHAGPSERDAILAELRPLARSERELRSWWDETSGDLARLYDRVLRSSPPAWRMVDNLCEAGGAVPLDELARSLFSEAPRADRLMATAVLLRLGGSARSDVGSPFLPSRLHVFARGPVGAYVCIRLGCDKSGLTYPGLGSLWPEYRSRCSCDAVCLDLRVCRGCGEDFLAGERKPSGDALDDLSGIAPPPAEPDGTILDLFVPRERSYSSSSIGLLAFNVAPSGDVAPEGARLQLLFEQRRDGNSRAIPRSKKTSLAEALSAVSDAAAQSYTRLPAWPLCPIKSSRYRSSTSFQLLTGRQTVARTSQSAWENVYRSASRRLGRTIFSAMPTSSSTSWPVAPSRPFSGPRMRQRRTVCRSFSPS
jgi:hypothetical protein